MLAEMDAYIRGLMEVDAAGREIPVLKGSRHVAFTGVLICNQSIRERYERLVENGSMERVPTFQLSQDHLELFFGQVGAFNGQFNTIKKNT